jgi:hypothetical protein
VRSRRRIGEFHQLQFAFAEEGHAAHVGLPDVAICWFLLMIQ